MVVFADLTPSPSPTPVTLTPGEAVFVTNLIAEDIATIVIGLFLILLIAIVLTRAIVKAGSLPPPATLVTALSVLTLLSIAGGITTNNDEAWAIAAAGIGALAGSVSTVYQNTVDDRIRHPEEKEPSTNGEPSTQQVSDDPLPEDG